MNDLRKAAQDIIEDVDSPYIPDEIRMVDVNLIEALRQAVQAEQDVPVYTPMTLDDMIKLFPAVVDELAMIRGTERAVIERLGMRWPE